MNEDDKKQALVTVREFEAFQVNVVKSLEGLHKSVESIARDNREQIERLYKTTRPNVTLWIALAGVGLSVILAVGGLVGYSFRREIDHSANATQRNSMWIDHYIKSDLEELRNRRAEDRRCAKPAKLDEND